MYLTQFKNDKSYKQPSGYIEKISNNNIKINKSINKKQYNKNSKTRKVMGDIT